MGQIGEKLREARQRKGLSFREVEEATKIRRKYLYALENEDFGVIPGRTYAKGFIRSYARYLEIDPRELITEFEAGFSSVYGEDDYEPPVPKPGPNSPKRFGKWMRLGLIVIIVAALVGINTFFEHNGSSNDQNTGSNPQAVESDQGEESSPDNVPPASNSENPPAQPQTEVQQPGQNLSETPVSGVELGVKVVGSRCWIKVISDDRNIFEGTLIKGDEKLFLGRSEIVITLGNAGAVVLTYNGKELPPVGGEGEVVTPPPFVSGGSEQ